ncbi:immunity protein YezG family protein [Virgibacillus sp. FSP13]
METKRMESIYQEVANHLNAMIPEEWEKILLYAEVREGMATVFFYYYPQNSNKPIYSLDIDEIFNIDYQELKKMERKLYEYFRHLWNEFKEQDQEPWTHLTFKLENTGKMNINYGYDDVSQMDPIEKQEKWEAEYLK